jgi:ribosomal protein S18 acetylase RimI-like enzyme
MVDGDVPAGLALCRSAGWNQTTEDWDLFLKLSPKGCCVAVDDEGQVRGTVATVRYENRFSWIGMVLVDPRFQRQGIGIQLLREALHILRDEDTIKLDATPQGRHIYLQLDFVDEYRISRMENKAISLDSINPSSARPVTEVDMRRILEFDQEVFGANREKLLKSILKRDPRLAFLVEGPGGINGYCFGRMGYNFTHIGPVVANDDETARNLVSAVLMSASGRPVCIDTLQRSDALTAWLASIGFTEQRPLIRMFRGDNRYPGCTRKQFAILGPEFG